MAYWIFQGSPAKFRVDKYLKENKVVAWSLRQKEFRDDIQLGDEVYIWRADGNEPGTSGIVAQGVIISLPELMKDEEQDLWIEPPPSDTALRVLIATCDVRLSAEDGMLLKTKMKHDSIIGEMPIITAPRRTNYRIGKETARHIRYLWAKADPKVKQELEK